MKTKPPLFNEYISWCQQPFQTWSTTALSTHRETPALTLWAPLWLGHVMNPHPYPACSGITGGWLACRHVLEKNQNSCRSAIGTVHKRTLGRINFHTGLIIPFLIGPLSGVFPFPHTSMMESKKTWRGMPGSWRWLRFHIGFWHWLKLRCYVSHLLGKNPVQKTWKDMLKNIVKLCCGQFGGKPREIGRCRSIGDWEEKSAEVPGESGWQTSWGDLETNHFIRHELTKWHGLELPTKPGAGIL